MEQSYGWGLGYTPNPLKSTIIIHKQCRDDQWVQIFFIYAIVPNLLVYYCGTTPSLPLRRSKRAMVPQKQRSKQYSQSRHWRNLVQQQGDRLQRIYKIVYTTTRLPCKGPVLDQLCVVWCHLAQPGICTHSIRLSAAMILRATHHTCTGSSCLVAQLIGWLGYLAIFAYLS